MILSNTSAMLGCVLFSSVTEQPVHPDVYKRQGLGEVRGNLSPERFPLTSPNFQLSKLNPY